MTLEEEKIVAWAWERKELVFDTADAAQSLKKRQWYTSRDYHYRRAYRALMRLQARGIVGAYHANQHAPKLFWLKARDAKLNEVK